MPQSILWSRGWSYGESFIDFCATGKLDGLAASTVSAYKLGYRRGADSYSASDHTRRILRPA